MDASMRGKFALVSDFVPPSTAWTGQAEMLRRLLTPLDESRYCVVSRFDVAGDAAGRLPGSYHRVGRQRPTELDTRLTGLPRLAWRAGSAVELVRRAQRLARVLRAEHCDAVVACPDRVGDLPTALLASRMAGARFYPYLFDDFRHKWLGSPLTSRFARAMEPLVIRGAAGVIVPNEFLANALRRRYDVEATIVRNACALDAYVEELPPAASHARPDAGVEIVFTGAVYEAHYDAFSRLLQALERMPPPSGRLHVYSPTAPSTFANRSLVGPLLHHGYVSSGTIPAIQRTADVLFLPLAFEAPYPEVIATSAPAKMAEYLAAGVPIIVHAPRESFLASYFGRHDCGIVVDEPSVEALVDALVRVRDDAALRLRLASAARQRAVVDFDIARAREAFLHLVASDSAP